jgi:prolyl-tRNA synthetase
MELKKTENEIKKITKATIRCIPFGNQDEGSCVFSGNHSKQRVLFAKAY